MPTVWLPEPEQDTKPFLWILEDGRLLEEPRLEISESGRRLRIEGQQATSDYAKNRDTIVGFEVKRRARQLGSEVLTCVKPDEWKPGAPPRLKREGTSYGPLLDSFGCRWLFKHPSLPLYAQLQVELQILYRSYKVSRTFTFTSIKPSNLLSPSELTLDGSTWTSLGHIGHDVASQIRDHYPDFHNHLGSVDVKNEREALRWVRTFVEFADDLDAIDIPDGRAPELRWLTLGPLDTNVDGEFRTQLSDFLDTAGLTDEITETYNKLRDLLRKVGIKLSDRTPGEFALAAALGDDEALAATIKTSDDDPEVLAHRTYLHLPTGTIRITCPEKVKSKAAADAWELARFEAEMRGELDAFLKFTSGKPQLREVIDLIERRR